jgi:hypothetical protein
VYLSTVARDISGLHPLKAVFVGLAAFVAVIGVASGPASATTLATGSQVTANTSGSLIAGGVTLGPVSGNTSATQTGANAADPFGWDPWGSADTNSHWLSVGGCCGGTSSAIFNVVAPTGANNFTLLWGSPNSNNTVQLFSGAGGTGTLVATVQFVDGSGFFVDGVLSGQFFGPNTTAPGYIESITTSAVFGSALLTNSNGGFEVADISASTLGVGTLSSTPLPAALPLFASGLGALGLLARRRKRKTAAVTA